MTDVIELAKQAGIDLMPADMNYRSPYYTCTQDELKAFAILVINAKLEEAAQKAFSWNTAMTDVLAKEIRELKEPTP